MTKQQRKTWRVRFHMNQFEPFPYRDETVDAYDRGHAITVAVLRTMNEAWAKRVKKSTASRVRASEHYQRGYDDGVNGRPMPQGTMPPGYSFAAFDYHKGYTSGRNDASR